MFSKTMTDFQYYAPTVPREAFELLDRFGGDASVMLGGTDLIPKMKSWTVNPKSVVSLKNINDFRLLDFSEKDGLRIGCAITLYELEKFPAVKERYPALYEGIHCIASTQIRTRGTVAGNICNAVPSADSAPPLLVLDAKIKIIGSAGERTVPISEFFTGVCKTVVQPNEIVSEIIVPTPSPDSKSIYYAHTIRRALDLAIVGVAANVRKESEICADVRIGLGAVAATPKRAVNAEVILKGQRLTDELIEKAAEIAGEQDCLPITDMRASAAYRREIVKVLTGNALKHCRNA
ncbi:MAG: xanthine dehydrogenase family protein subunit M [Clostridiales Family XIII bacterium]|jgi:carbon-monoxide dehydrogenase medium subunit|nr:xanthine dehydrogenase family protein subunit M [Clostridiales Family XIII bacterium]